MTVSGGVSPSPKGGIDWLIVSLTALSAQSGYIVTLKVVV